MSPSTPVVPDPGTSQLRAGQPVPPQPASPNPVPPQPAPPNPVPPRPAPHHPVPPQPIPPQPGQWVLPGRPDQVGHARRLVAESLGTCPAAGDAVLLTSELAANAVQHTASGSGGTFGVTVSHHAALLRVEVHDAGAPAPPAVITGDGLRPSGRGMMLVAALAARWGHQGDESGRAVWFELNCQRQARPGEPAGAA